MQRNPLWGLSLTAVALFGVLASCSNEADNCKRWKSCKPEGGTTSVSGGEAGAESGGASGSGGTNGAANAGTSAGGKSATTTGGASTVPATTTEPCNGKCSGSTPICNDATSECVACLTSSHCTEAGKPVCDTSSNTCVGCLTSDDCSSETPVCDLETTTCVTCLSNAECTTATASRCEPSTNTCAACEIDDDCSQIDGKHVCASGACVQCTVAKEAACGTNSCNPVASACTTTPRGSVNICRTCLADSECIGGNLTEPTARCVPMHFDGAPHGNYCLQRAATVSSCARPYSVGIDAASVSGASSETYCGINAEVTTCDAVVDMIASKTCVIDTDCGSEKGGLCKQVGPGTNPPFICTIPCSKAEQCADGDTCDLPLSPYCH
jgi:hypothetical protein